MAHSRQDPRYLENRGCTARRPGRWSLLDELECTRVCTPKSSYLAKPRTMVITAKETGNLSWVSTISRTSNMTILTRISAVCMLAQGKLRQIRRDWGTKQGAQCSKTIQLGRYHQNKSVSMIMKHIPKPRRPPMIQTAVEVNMI